MRPLLSLSLLLVIFSVSCQSTRPESVSTTDSRALNGPLVISENWPRCTDLVSWAQDIWRIDGLTDASETRKAIALFNWVRLYNRIAVGGPGQMFEGLPGEEAYIQDPHKTAFVYGWGFCDTHSRIMEALWQELYQDSTACYRVCCKDENGGYHTMYRLRADGAYQAYDARFAFYLMERDNPSARVLDWHEVGVDTNVTMNEKFINRQPIFWEAPVYHREYILKIKPVFWENESGWDAAGNPAFEMFTSRKHKLGRKYHDMNWRLVRGMKIERFWDNSARQFYRTQWIADQNKPAKFLPSGRFHAFHESRQDSVYMRLDPNWRFTKPYHMEIPAGEGYPEQAAGDKALGQAWGKVTYNLPLTSAGVADLLTDASNLALSGQSPHLRPDNPDSTAGAVFDFYCPFILTEGTFGGVLAGGESGNIQLEMRTLAPKADSREQPDKWSEWFQLASGAVAFETTLGYEQYERRENTVHGKYRFQLRFTAQNGDSRDVSGLDSLWFTLYFENGIMALPQLAAGENRVDFELNAPNPPAGPVIVVYNWLTAAGDAMSKETSLAPEDFSGGKSGFNISAPGLERCTSVSMEY